MFWAALLGIVVTMFLALIRGVKGPTVYDRILALNNFGTNTVLLIACAGFDMGIHDQNGLEIIQPTGPGFGLGLCLGQLRGNHRRFEICSLW